MAVFFPPEPVYPLAIDSDTTLFLVYNTSETHLAQNNQAWSDEMEIVPVGENDPEIWADNGFANIEGELFYYDSVEKDSNGKVYKFKQIARGVAGKKSKFNLAGVWVRGFVIAEHHNQVSLTLQIIERFIGTRCTDTSDCSNKTLDCRIRRLLEENPCNDDHGCPEASVDYRVVSTDNCSGTLIDYNVQISGTFNSYRLDFGDGSFTTADQAGTHLYAPNSTIDPVVSIGNERCQIVQTPLIRQNPTEPEQVVATSFEIPIPPAPDFPTIVIPEITVPSTTLELPQIFQSCANTGTGGIPNISITPPIPSVISIGPPINVPSVISINPPIPSMISFGPAPFIPAVILFGPAPFLGPILFGPAPTVQFGPAPTIQVSVPSFSPLQFGPAPSISIEPCPSCSPITFDDPPTISVDWGTPPTCSCTVSVVCPGPGPSPSPFRMNSLFLEDDFIDGFEPAYQVESSGIGIPSEIRIIAPIMPEVKMVHSLPEQIQLVGPNIPDKIQIIGPEIPLPTQISVVSNLPSTISAELKGLEKLEAIFSTPLKLAPIPPLQLELPKDFLTIKLDASDVPDTIKVTGFPEVISVQSNMPNEIIARLEMPENFKIPIVYEGGPLKIEWDVRNIVGDQGKGPCFMMVPCDAS